MRMASFGFQGSPEHNDVQDISLSQTQREFLNFLLYQYGDAYIGDAGSHSGEWSQWYGELRDKLDA